VYGGAGNGSRTMGWRCDLDGVEHGRGSNGTRLSRGVNRRDAGSTRQAATEDGQEVLLMDWGARYLHCRQSLAWRCRAKKANVGWSKEAAPGRACRRYRDATMFNERTFPTTRGNILTGGSSMRRRILLRLRGGPMPSREAAMA
jgi:hypothetical protein